MYRPYFQRWLFAGVFLGCLLLPWLLRAQVSISLDRSSVAVGEMAQLRVTIDLSDLNSYPEIPPVAGLGFAQNSSLASSVIVNGAKKARLEFGYQVTTTKEGEFTIGPVKVKAGGQFHQSNAVKLKVTAAKAANPEAEANRVAFLQLNVAKKEFYLGEMLPLELSLYFQNARGEVPQLNTEGFLFSAQPRHTQNRVRMANGVYQQHTFRYAIKALKTGDLTLGPAQSNLEVQIPVQEADPLFGGMIQRYRSQPMTVRSEAVGVKVLPLPEEGKPASFNGAIGRFNFRLSSTKNDVAVGDPVILQVEISGQGAWDAVQLPPMDDWRDFKVYPPNSEFKPLDDLGIQGLKRYELVVVPENSAVKEIPALAFSFFDTDARKYQTINVAAIPLKVRASSGAPVQPTVTSGTVKAAGEEPAAAKDILHIKPHLGTVLTVTAPAVASPWFWGLNLVPLLGWAMIVFWKKQAEREARNPRAQRAKAVALSEAAGLAQLGTLASAGSSKEFFDQLAKLLQERLGERLDMPASAITEAVIEERLAPAGVREEARRELHELFQACNQARYAPVSDVAKLDALVERASKVLGELAVREIRAV